MKEALKILTWVSELNETNMYCVMEQESGKGIVIDPSDEKAASEWKESLGLEAEYILLSHEHYDHIAALEAVRQMFCDAKVVASKECSERIQSPGGNLSKYFNVILEFQKEKYPQRNTDFRVEAYRGQPADVTFEGRMQLDWRGHEIDLQEAPGHSKGSILVDVDGRYLFSGDTISYDYELITGFPGSSRREYEEKTRPVLEGLDQQMKVYPGHGRSFVLKEAEKG